jgi:hypothetical protein
MVPNEENMTTATYRENVYQTGVSLELTKETRKLWKICSSAPKAKPSHVTHIPRF